MDGVKPTDVRLASRLTEAQALKPATKDPQQAAEQFEGLLLQEMFKSMWQSSSPEKGLLGSDEEQTYRDMLNEAIATSAAKGKGIGIKDVISRELNETMKKSGNESVE